MSSKSARHGSGPATQEVGLRQALDALERVVDGVFALDVRWHFTYLNREGSRHFGRPAEKLLGKHIWTEYPDFLGQSLHVRSRKAMESQTPAVFEWRSPVDERSFEARLHPSPDGLTVILHALGEREDHLADPDARQRLDERWWLAQLLEGLPLPLLLIAPGSGRLRFGNTAALHLLGEGLLEPGTPEPTAWFVAPGGGPLEWESWPQARAARGEELDAVPFELHLERGRMVVLCTSSRLEAAGGYEEVVALVFQDVTPLKDLEEALSRSVQDHDEFLSIASHELRTPLTSASLQLQALSGVVRNVVGEAGIGVELGARVVGMQRSLGRLAKLLEGLLDVSLFHGARLVVEQEDVDASELLNEILSRMVDDFASFNCIVHADVQPGVTGRWDRMRLEQVTTNLLTNALKYGRGAPIHVSLIADAESARLVVRDHGIGIKPEDQSRIFHAFERAVSARHYGGLGLGLWIVRQIVEALGGRIRVESAPGEGAAFVVDLPRVPDVSDL